MNCGFNITFIYTLKIISSVEINIFGVLDTMPCTNQFVPDIKEIVTNLYWTMTVTGRLFQGSNIIKLPVGHMF